MTYKNKYLKYKNKYLNLQKMIGGSNSSFPIEKLPEQNIELDKARDTISNLARSLHSCREENEEYQIQLDKLSVQQPSIQQHNISGNVHQVTQSRLSPFNPHH
jgi:hypothetical protein